MKTIKADERHIICKVRVQAEHRDIVKALLLDLIGPARREEGCLYYHLYQQSDQLNDFYIVDGWASEQAVAAHLAHPNVIRVVEQLLPRLASPLEITTNIRVSEPE
jgi:quinol monooxygenase YgiN